MKPISFLRTTWRKKDSSTKTRPPEQVSTEVNTVPTLPKMSFGDESILSFHAAQVPVRYHPTQENVKPIPQAERQRMVTDKQPASRNRHIAPTTNLRMRGHHGAPFNPSYGPPHNPSHGPPSFVLPGREFASGKDFLNGSPGPSRSPLPPFADPAIAPPSSSRVKFAPVLQTRPQPDSSTLPASSCAHSDKIDCDCDPTSSLEDRSAASDSHESDSCYSQESQPSYPRGSIPPYSEQYKSLDHVLRDHNHDIMTSEHLGPGAALIHRYEPNPPKRSTHAPIEPRTNNGTLRVKRESARDGMLSASPLTLFPSPPPLVIRRRPKPLVLPPMPTIEAPLPPSPAFSSTDSTPIATPTALHPQKPHPTLPPSKITNRKMLYSMPPPSCSPPNTPLPALPVSVPPNHDARAFHPSSWNSRLLRSAQSATELQELPVEKRRPSTSHRTTASVPVPVVSYVRKRANSRPEAIIASTYLLSKGRAMPAPTSSIDTQVQWGYAV